MFIELTPPEHTENFENKLCLVYLNFVQHDSKLLQWAIVNRVVRNDR